MTGDAAVILIVEDEPPIRRLLRTTLTAQDYRPIEAATGGEALSALRHHRPDLVLLDLGLPDIDGLDLIGRIRAVGPVPIVVLSSRGDEAAKVRALDSGADDYVTKPFGMDELLARLRAAVRRSTSAGPGEEEAVIETGSFTVDLAAKKVLKEGAEVHLTPTEWGVLEVLVRNKGRLVAQKQLLQEVWGPAYAAETHYLRVYLAQLRRKLEPQPSHPRHLLTEPGMGYRFETA